MQYRAAGNSCYLTWNADYLWLTRRPMNVPQITSGAISAPSGVMQCLFDRMRSGKIERSDSVGQRHWLARRFGEDVSLSMAIGLDWRRSGQHFRSLVQRPG